MKKEVAEIISFMEGKDMTPFMLEKAEILLTQKGANKEEAPEVVEQLKRMADTDKVDAYKVIQIMSIYDKSYAWVIINKMEEVKC